MLSADEFWFLDTAVREMILVRAVADSPGNLIARFNAAPHSLSAVQVADTLWRMHTSGYLFLCNDSQPRSEFTRDEVWAEVERSEVHQGQLRYGLTDLGGSVWESAACPNWDRYYIDTYDDGKKSEEVELSLSAGNEDRLSELFTHFSYSQFDIVESFDQLPTQIMSPWKATYWKVLPVVIGICCRGTHKVLAASELSKMKAYLYGTGKGRAVKVWRRYGLGLNESESIFS